MAIINISRKDFEAKKSDYNRLTLLKTYKNGSQDYSYIVTCPECGGKGYLTWTSVDNGRCWVCDTKGKILQKIHVSDTIRLTPTKEEFEENLKKIREANLKYNLDKGYKLVDFKLANWFCGSKEDKEYNYGKYYLIEKETEKALLISFIDNLESMTSYSEWFPKAAIRFDIK